MQTKKFFVGDFKLTTQLCTTESVEGQSRRKTMLIETKSKYLKNYSTCTDKTPSYSNYLDFHGTLHEVECFRDQCPRGDSAKTGQTFQANVSSC